MRNFKIIRTKWIFARKHKKISEYLSKAFYSITQNENQQLILNIDNKGSKDNFAVGNIRIENLNGADESIIKQCIEDCLLQRKCQFNSR